MLTDDLLTLTSFIFGNKWAGEKNNTVTTVTVDQVMQAIGELNTYEYQYTGNADIINTRQVLGMNVLGTTHKIHVVYSGVIKVGYDVTSIGASVDNLSKTITVSLPNAQVTNNYIDMNDVDAVVENNPFNPADSEKEVAACLENEKQNQLQSAINDGLYSKADVQAKTLITSLLSCYNGYVVKFI